MSPSPCTNNTTSSSSSMADGDSKTTDVVKEESRSALHTTRLSAFNRWDVRFQISPKIIYFCIGGLFYTFTVHRMTFFRQFLNIYEQEAGIIQGFANVASFIGVAAWSNFADRYAIHKRMLIFLALLMALLFELSWLKLVIPQYWWFYLSLLIFTIYGGVTGGVLPLTDYHVLRLLKDRLHSEHSLYGRQVLFGTAAYGLLSYVLGVLIDRFDVRVLLVVMPILAVVAATVVAVLGFPDYQYEHGSSLSVSESDVKEEAFIGSEAEISNSAVVGLGHDMESDEVQCPLSANLAMIQRPLTQSSDLCHVNDSRGMVVDDLSDAQQQQHESICTETRNDGCYKFKRKSNERGSSLRKCHRWVRSTKGETCVDTACESVCYSPTSDCSYDSADGQHLDVSAQQQQKQLERGDSSSSDGNLSVKLYRQGTIQRYLSIISQPRFSLFLLLILCIGTGRQVLTLFLPSFLRQAIGLTDSDVGLAYLGSCIFSITFLSTGRIFLRRLGVYPMLIVGLGALTLRLFGYAMLARPQLKPYRTASTAVVIEFLNGLSFAFTHLAGVQEAAACAPEGWQVTFQGVYALAYVQLPAIYVSLIGGYVFKWDNGASLMTWSFLLTLVAFCLVVMVRLGLWICDLVLDSFVRRRRRCAIILSN